MDENDISNMIKSRGRERAIAPPRVSRTYWQAFREIIQNSMVSVRYHSSTEAVAFSLISYKSIL